MRCPFETLCRIRWQPQPVEDAYVTLAFARIPLCRFRTNYQDPKIPL
jgi:hypothetical protein